MNQQRALLSRRVQAVRGSEIRELLKLLDRPGMTSFAGGIPDPSLFDLDAFGAACASSLQGGKALQYSTSEGYLPLREWIAERMREKDIACGPEHVLITNGSQQALDLIGKLSLDPGDTVLTAAPTYLGALQSFRIFEPRFDTVHFRDGGASAGGARAKLMYLVPDFANPTGATLDRHDRVAALELAEEHGALLVEDAAYVDLRYEGEAPPAIASLDQRRCGSIEAMRTLYCGTFSKTLSPGLRIGWICGPSALIQRLVLIKQAADLHTSTLGQWVMHEVAGAGFGARLALARDTYRARRDAMLEALDRHAPTGMRWTRPKGGFFIWATLPHGVDAAALLRGALERNIAFVPGQPFFADGSGSNTLRLSFSLADQQTSARGIAALCALVEERLAEAHAV
ncbi:aminotransferase-like domain-containing protein [Sabulicella glaciei]|uniref:PLP-dependent aminotransferase family protein n=1 Tax=Sabulicella glaciei TaxID=2984948 RepID=A0ABT3NZD2_9PROT|nr:PLP-dependent aminotransferase family protein [Roseococcus sp. MDT2-1-1]MCW8087521.1 PLP-dependent aminotransferase family protein [Roseococcus sp. MDT2-1-1]